MLRSNLFSQTDKMAQGFFLKAITEKQIFCVPQEE